MFSRYPGVTSVDVADVLSRIQSILDRIAAVIRFVGGFSIVSGVIILSSSVAATRFQRIRESVLLKTLGATRARVAGIHATEFTIVGLAAGAIGSLLAAAAANYLLVEWLETEFEMRWLPLAVTVLATTGLTVITGWISSRGVLNHRPLEVLREN
jgi:putative ABC transport system permease protein